MAGDRSGLPVLGDPPRDALTQAKLQPIDQLLMRVHRSPQDEFISLEDVDKAGIAVHDGRNDLYDEFENHVNGIGCRNALPDLMQEIDLRMFGTHSHAPV